MIGPNESGAADSAQARQPSSTAKRHRPAPGRFVLATASVWLFLSLAASVVISWFAAAIEPYFAPWLLFPAVIGLALGWCLTWLLRWSHMGHRATAVAGTLLCAAVVVVAHHLWHYQAWIQVERQARLQALPLLLAQPQAAEELLRRPNFWAFIRHEAARGRNLWPGYTTDYDATWASWAADALTLTAVALAIVIAATRRPYCNICHDWYRLGWEQRLSEGELQRLSRAGLAPPPEHAGAASMRVWACRGGCQPARVEIAWRSAPGSRPRQRATTLWLSPTDVRMIVLALRERPLPSGESQSAEKPV